MRAPRFASWDGKSSVQHSTNSPLMHSSVHEYNVTSGTVTLRDRFPPTFENGRIVLAKVDNEMLSLNTELLQVGAWVNIIGYARKPVRVKVATQRVSGKKAPNKVPLVDATMVWSAGAIQHDKYQAAVKSYQTTP